MNKIMTATYKGEHALVLENDLLKVTLLPGWGSKIASLFFKPAQYETLWQNPAEEYRETRYGDPYDRGEASGFDEMFPTISRCFYEDPPWNGIEMPDHGEVWSIPWAHGLGGDLVRLWVNGVRFPYRLEKRVYLEDDTLHLQYRAENPSPSDLHFIWAAHPLFNASPGMEIIVPGGMNRIVNSVPSNRLGPYGRIYDFPGAGLEGGRVFDLSRIPEQHSADYQKYWFLGRVTEGWCVLHDPKRGLSIGLAWPEDSLPYLGMWVNEGGWADQYNIAPEPATGAMDRVDFARMWGMSSVLHAGEQREWRLTITMRQGERPKSGPLGV
jgi:galactose mutarotase-like enzyme